MGNSVSSAMSDAQAQAMKRQIVMNREIQEKQMAMMLAWKRDMFHYFAAFYFSGLPLAVFAASKGKHMAIVPFLPLSFVLAYQFDGAYGGKMNRVRVDAEELLRTQPHLFALPGGFPTFQELNEKAAEQQQHQQTNQK